MGRSRLWRRNAVLVGIGLALALAQVWTRLQIVAIGYEIANTQQLIHSLEGERQDLEMQWSALVAPSRLAIEAERRLRMSGPQPEQVVQMP